MVSITSLIRPQMALWGLCRIQWASHFQSILLNNASLSLLCTVVTSGHKNLTSARVQTRRAETDTRPVSEHSSAHVSHKTQARLMKTMMSARWGEKQPAGKTDDGLRPRTVTYHARVKKKRKREFSRRTSSERREDVFHQNNPRRKCHTLTADLIVE